MRTLAVTGWLLLAGQGLHAEEPFELDPVVAACAECHGSDGRGNPALETPALAGQLSSYLSRQLAGFRDGRRGGHPADLGGATMSEASVGMSDEQIQALADYYARLPAMLPQEDALASKPTGTRSSMDEALYRDACSHCHGESGEGHADMGAPRLDMLTVAYLRRQMDSFASGQRGMHRDDDLQALWMHDIAAHDGDREVLDGAIRFIAVDGASAD